MVEAVGCTTELASRDHAGDNKALRKELRQWQQLLQLGLVFTIPAFMIAMVLPHLDPSLKRAFMTELAPRLPLKFLLLFLLTTPVQLVLGRRFYIGAYTALKHRSANMDVLIAGGTTAAYLYSIISIAYGMSTPGFESQQ